MRDARTREVKFKVIEDNGFFDSQSYVIQPDNTIKHPGYSGPFGDVAREINKEP
jgi:hypothetical protein